MLAVWFLVLVLQAGSSTWASRARNTTSLPYHAVAATFSHGTWFATSCFMVDSIVSIAKRGEWTEAVWLGAFYTVSCVIGSVLAHAVELKLRRRVV